MAKSSKPLQAEIDERSTGLIYALVIAVGVVIGGVALGLYARGRWWLPPVASQHGPEVDRLFYSTLFITTIVFAGVHLLLAYVIWKAAAHRDRKALHFAENHRLELTYTIVPAIGLAIMVAMGGVVWTKMHRPAPDTALDIDYRAEQFGWLARYPGPDGKFGQVGPKLIDQRRNPMGLVATDAAAADDVTSRELHFVVNRPARLRLRSTGVIHSFFIPAMRVKQDVMPGQTITIWFTPTREGKFEVVCAELCGVGHYVMRGNVVVESQQAFDAWLATQKPALQAGQ
jgi:cytochrome c oxidase subunit 2